MPPALGQRKRDTLMLTYLAVPSVAYVARVCGVRQATVRKYREKDGWEAKAAEFNQALVDAGLESLEAVRHELDGIAKGLLERFKREAADGLIKAESVADLIRLGEFRLMLRGEATMNVGVKVLPSGKPMVDATREELDEAAAQMMAEHRHYERRLAMLEGNGKGNGSGTPKVIDVEAVPAKGGKR